MYELFLYEQGLQMLIKTQVKRRAETINQYILSLKTKVQTRHYRQAIQFLRNSRESVYNSYMAPYNPSAYLLDSLKTKNEKLLKQRQGFEQRILAKLSDINKIKIKRGYTKYNIHVSQKSKNSQNSQFITKLRADQLTAYISRLQLKLQDVQKIDYESISLQTDFQIVRILVEQNVSIIPLHAIVGMQSNDIYLMIYWKGQKNSNKTMILKFEDEQERKIWTRCLNFSKLVCQCETKDRLFFKEEKLPLNVSGKQESKFSEDQQKQPIQKQPNYSKNLNLNINGNKSSAFDRLRRKSQYYPTLLHNNSNVFNKPKERKVSQDLTLKQPLFRNPKLNNQKSLKSFDEDFAPTNPNVIRKDQNKKQIKIPDISSNKIQRLVEERQKLQVEFKNQNQSTHSNRQIFFNESSIHWIEEQNQQIKSKSSSLEKVKPGRRNQELTNRQESIHQSQHISEVPAQIQQSPLLPYNLRQKRRNNNNKFQVQIHEVERTGNEKSFSKSNKSQKSLNKSKGKSTNKSKHDQMAENQNEDDVEPEEGSEQNQDEIQSINEQMDDQQQSEEKSKINERSNLEVEDKSLDLVSQNENSETQSTKFGLDELKNGIFMIKCSPNSWGTRKKKLHLSNNDTQLCWKNERGDDLKKIYLSDIEKIEYNKITPGITKHMKNIEKRRCLAIKYKLKNEYKILELYLPEESNVSDLQNFYEKLNTYVKYKNNDK